jgi:hypothetical protein
VVTSQAGDAKKFVWNGHFYHEEGFGKQNWLAWGTDV